MGDEELEFEEEINPAFLITFQVTPDKLIRVERRKPEFEEMEAIEEEEPQG